MQIKLVKSKWAYALTNLVLLITLGFWVYQKNQAVDMISPQLPENKLQCVSYAPYYKKGDSPLIEVPILTSSFWSISFSEASLLTSHFSP